MANNTALKSNDRMKKVIFPCDICHKAFTEHRTALCTSCAKATLYGPRIEQAASLLGREKAHLHAEAVIRPGNDGVIASLPEDADWDAITIAIKTQSFERANAEREALDEKMRSIQAKADEVRRWITHYKKVSAPLQEENDRRRQELANARIQLEKRRSHALEPVNLAIKKARHRLEKVHKRTVEAREHLCMEVSLLSGLQRVKTEDNKTEYNIGKVAIPDLRDLNGIDDKIKTESIDTVSGEKSLVEPHEIISASLDSICRFLGILSHYLSVRLPAEMILPHNDFPHAAILPRDSSYRYSNVRYPGFGSSQSSSPYASRVLQKKDSPRPRVLQLDRPLTQLQKDDAKAASLFVEGVSLLAYNVAWLCRSQGATSVNTFEDVCRIGRNLYDLLPRRAYNIQERPDLTRKFTSATTKTEQAAAFDEHHFPRFGTHSHGSARHFLAGHEGFELFKADAWNMSAWRISDQLQAYLRNEITRAEWHIVDDTEWDEEREDERPVLVGGARRHSLDAKEPAMSVLSVRPSDGTDETGLPTTGPKGNSGWMKVRGRPGDG